ncbi:MAG TPA: peptide chain release factor 1, partial [Planctomycetes bacterium]|nr:peptide chain release factor 1 [Planctomycetota bacterium]
LRARLAEQAQRAGRRQRNRQRREQVGRGRRADKVRTLAYQRGRVEDHRSGKRLSLRRFERGELEELH